MRRRLQRESALTYVHMGIECGVPEVCHMGIECGVSEAKSRHGGLRQTRSTRDPVPGVVTRIGANGSPLG